MSLYIKCGGNVDAYDKEPIEDYYGLRRLTQSTSCRADESILSLESAVMSRFGILTDVFTQD